MKAFILILIISSNGNFVHTQQFGDGFRSLRECVNVGEYVIRNKVDKSKSNMDVSYVCLPKK